MLAAPRRHDRHTCRGSREPDRLGHAEALRGARCHRSSGLETVSIGSEGVWMRQGMNDGSGNRAVEALRARASMPPG